jgi:hypothetical protein
VELTIHLLIHPAFPHVKPDCSFAPFQSDASASVGMYGDEPPTYNLERAEVKVLVPDGSKVEMCFHEGSSFTGCLKLVVLGLPHPLTAVEVLEFAKSGKHGFAILEGAGAK